jgi:hypothetical protein
VNILEDGNVVEYIDEKRLVEVYFHIDRSNKVPHSRMYILE